MSVDPPQSCHPHATPEDIEHPHIRNLALAAQSCELSPGTLFGQHFDQ
jgi:hypothetical protein